MSSSDNGSSNTQTNVVGLLGVLFVGLKLTGYINWPWLWVLAPFWIPLAIVVGVFLALFVVLAIEKSLKDATDARR